MNRIDTSQEIEQLLGADDRARFRSKWKSWAIWAAAGIVVALFLLSLVRGVGAGNETEFVTQAATRGALSVTVTATGTTEPRNEVSVGIEVSGTIAEVLADFNDAVTEGQVLARLDTRILAAQTEQSRASLHLARASQSEAEATLRQNENEFARLIQLKDTSGGVLPSARDLDSAKAARDRAQASVASARAQVRQAEAQLAVQQTELSLAEIVSPIDGVVLSRKVDPGQTVAATFQTPELFVIAEDLTEMQLSIEIDEADVGKVKEGQAATFTVDAYPEIEFPAQISTLRFAPVSSAGVVTYEAILSVDNSELLLRPGMTATAIVTVEEVADALLISNAALRFAPRLDQSREEESIMSALIPRPPGSNAPANTEFSGQDRTIWRLTEDGDLQGVEVRIGPSDGNHTVVVEGSIDAGDRLVVEQRDPL